jgi:hypothetical protein
MKLNFITDQGSILDSTSWARRVWWSAPLGVGRSAPVARDGGRDGTTGLGRAGLLGRGLDRAANGAVILDATEGVAACGTWAGYGGGWRWYGGTVIPSAGGGIGGPGDA